MTKEFENMFNRLDESTVRLFLSIDNIIHECFPDDLKEKLWQSSPIYYLDDVENFKPFSNCRHNKAVHIAPFKGHVSIYADAIKNHYDELKDYKITPKAGMLQIFCKDKIPKDVLIKIFKESLT